MYILFKKIYIQASETVLLQNHGYKLNYVQPEIVMLQNAIIRASFFASIQR
jgi:hypothetical protein